MMVSRSGDVDVVGPLFDVLCMDFLTCVLVLEFGMFVRSSPKRWRRLIWFYFEVCMLLSGLRVFLSDMIPVPVYEYMYNDRADIYTLNDISTLVFFPFNSTCEKSIVPNSYLREIDRAKCYKKCRY